MFMEETSGKPSVCDWLNPNNTIHNNTGRVLGWVSTQTQTQNPQTCLWRYVTSKSYFLCFFLCGRSFSRRVFELFSRSNHSFQYVFHKFSTSFQQSKSFQQRTVIHMSWRSYANKVKTRRCPFCGTERPLDWFIEIDKPTGDKRC